MNRRGCEEPECAHVYYAKNKCLKHYHKARNEELKKTRDELVAQAKASQAHLRDFPTKTNVTGSIALETDREKKYKLSEIRGNSLGIVRPMDSLGRITLPMEIRKKFELHTPNAVEFYIDGNTLILKKYAPGCLLCGNMQETRIFKNQVICLECLQD
ncbi:AbrB/MazE/SpoVT family DNA-binding domain-containing protein [Streptomyces avermitilis]